MKFGDKLILLRKQKGLSQEELAEKLGVSRQSVSKWESNNTYPETDKIVQICNIFDCSMDDLINDQITDINQTTRKNKTTINEAIDSFMDFITKTINMFYNMKFTSGLKCVIEMMILAFILYIVGALICDVSSNILANLFNLFGYNIARKIDILLNAILSLIWFILSAIIIIHTFKIRYLNYYEQNKLIEETTDSKEKKIESSKKEKIKKEEKIIIRDENDQPYAFLRLLGNIILWIIKIILIWILFNLSIGIIILIIGLCLTLSVIGAHKLFIGLFLSLIAGTIIGMQIIIIGICFIFNKKVHIKAHIIIFLLSLLLCGGGIASMIISIKDIKVIDTNDDIVKLEEKTIPLTYKEDLVIIKEGNGRVDSYDYIMDNTMDNNQILVTTEIDTRYQKVTQKENNSFHNDQMNKVVISEEFNGDFKAMLNILTEDIKKNQIHLQYYYNNSVLKVTANEETIQRLKENLKKLYLIQETQTENSIHIEIKDDKVYFPSGIEGYYDARDDSIHIEDVSNYSCLRSITETKWGDKIIYSCNYEQRYGE